MHRILIYTKFYLYFTIKVEGGLSAPPLPNYRYSVVIGAAHFGGRKSNKWPAAFGISRIHRWRARTCCYKAGEPARMALAAGITAADRPALVLKP